MNHPHDDRDPIEHDPTGMRALLGSLPDPGPMPEHLVSRISAALADEARQAGTWAAPECPPELRADDDGVRPSAAPAVAGTGGATPTTTAPAGSRPGRPDADAIVVPLHQRRGLRVLAAAAAVIGVLGLGGLVVESTTPGGLQAALGLVGAGSSADSAAAGGSVAESAPRARPSAGVLAADPDLHVQVLTPGGPITTEGLADHAATLPTGADDAVAPQDASAGSDGPVTSPTGARDCATGLGIPADDEVLVQPVDVDGTPAALVVATATGGARTAWAVAPTCSSGDPGVLAGPVPVP